MIPGRGLTCNNYINTGEVFSVEKYFPSLSPLPFFNLQNLTNVLFTMNCFAGKFDKCFNVANNLHDDCMKTYGLWRPVMDGAKAPITLPIKKQTTHTMAT